MCAVVPGLDMGWVGLGQKKMDPRQSLCRPMIISRFQFHGRMNPLVNYGVRSSLALASCCRYTSL